MTACASNNQNGTFWFLNYIRIYVRSEAHPNLNFFMNHHHKYESDVQNHKVLKKINKNC